MQDTVMLHESRGEVTCIRFGSGSVMELERNLLLWISEKHATKSP